MKILLIGQMGSGKDEAADYLAVKYNLHREKLGVHIRDHIDEIFFDLTKDQRRSFYQAYGEGMRDIFGKNFWCERLEKRLKRDEFIVQSRQGIIITDCRQQHEIDYFSKLGFIILAIDADSTTRLKRLMERDGDNFDIEAFTHPTEQSADRLIDCIKYGSLDGFVVKNTSTVEHLHQQLDRLIELCSGVTV